MNAQQAGPTSLRCQDSGGLAQASAPLASQQARRAATACAALLRPPSNGHGPHLRLRDGVPEDVALVPPLHLLHRLLQRVWRSWDIARQLAKALRLRGCVCLCLCTCASEGLLSACQRPRLQALLPRSCPCLPVSKTIAAAALNSCCPLPENAAGQGPSARRRCGPDPHTAHTMPGSSRRAPWVAVLVHLARGAGRPHQGAPRRERWTCWRARLSAWRPGWRRAPPGSPPPTAADCAGALPLAAHPAGRRAVSVRGVCVLSGSLPGSAPASPQKRSSASPAAVCACTCCWRAGGGRLGGLRPWAGRGCLAGGALALPLEGAAAREGSLIFKLGFRAAWPSASLRAAGRVMGGVRARSNARAAGVVQAAGIHPGSAGVRAHLGAG